MLEVLLWLANFKNRVQGALPLIPRQESASAGPGLEIPSRPSASPEPECRDQVTGSDAECDSVP